MAFQRGARAARAAASDRAPTPVCRPCRTGDCQRCPTAISRHAQNGFHSDYDCPHYRTDPEGHANAVFVSDCEFEDRHFRDFIRRETSMWWLDDD